MITIINYDRKASLKISYLLTELNIEHRISNIEKEIIESDKLILPDGVDIHVIFKKLHLLNLYSLLKMVQKPILGLGTGMFLMCDNITEDNVCGLGMLPISNLSLVDHAENHSIKLQNINNSKILNSINNDTDFTINKLFKIPICKYTTSTYKIDGEEFSASIEKGNRFGFVSSIDTANFQNNQILNSFNSI